jgi:hypothetical protein
MDPVAELEAEWPRIAAGSLARALPAWREARPALRPFSTPAALLAFLHRAPPDRTDPVLHALLVLSRSDPAAARLCLQAVLPGLKAQARRLAHRPGRREEAWELLLASAWEVVRAYPPGRTRRVAANVVFESLHRATRERRRIAPTAGADPFEDAGYAGVAPSAGGGLLEDAVADGVLDGEDAELIARTRLDGHRLGDLAGARGVSYAALLKRRQRAESRLRAWLVARGVRNPPPATLTPVGEDTRPAQARHIPDASPGGPRPSPAG